MDSFRGKLAVVTGGGSGMGRELVRQLATRGCSVAACDVHAKAVAETAALARRGAPRGVRVTSHRCDVSDETQILRFRDELLAAHACDHVDLVFNNAGVGGGGSFVRDPREQWERTFAIDWWGVYHCSRAFLPLLIASQEGVLVNTSSVDGFWATLGPGMPNTAYSTAKFAVKGFSEALIEDLRTNAPHVRVAVVMPGHVGTDIVRNTMSVLGLPGPERMSDAELEDARAGLVRRGALPEGASAEEVRRLIAQGIADFRDKAPLSAADAATIILDGVQSGAWRILVGEDARMLDALVREKPEAAYDWADLASRGQRRRAAAAGPRTPANVAPETRGGRGGNQRGAVESVTDVTGPTRSERVLERITRAMDELSERTEDFIKQLDHLSKTVNVLMIRPQGRTAASRTGLERDGKRTASRRTTAQRTAAKRTSANPTTKRP